MSIELPDLKLAQSPPKQQPTSKASANINRLLKILPHKSYDFRSHALSFALIYLSPDSTLAVAYNTLFLAAFYFLQVHITLTMTFGLYFLSSELSNNLFALYYWVIVGFYMLDLALTFFKGYYHKKKGIIIDNIRKMARRYLKFQFWIDFLNISSLLIPYLSQAPNSELAFFVPLLFTWIKKYQIQNEFIHSIQYYKKLRNFAKILLLTCDMLLIGHYGACLFLKIDLLLEADNFYSNKNLYWYTQNDPYFFTQYDGHWYLYYLYAQSFSTGTLSTFGPGPFSKNPISMLFSLIVSTFYILLTSYVADILIGILEAGSDERLEYEEGIEMIGKFMKEKKVTLKLQVFVINNFEIIWQSRYKHSHDEQQSVINMLPESLKRELILELSFISKIYLFKSFNKPQILVYELSKKIKRKLINENALFFFDAESDSSPGQQPKIECKSINFLADGMVEYFIECNGVKNNSHVALSNINRFVGFYEFFTKQVLFYNCRTLNLCQFNIIEREDFDEAINLTKNKEMIHKITNELLFYNRNHLVNRICMLCQEDDHIESACPQIIVSIRYKLPAINKYIKGTQDRNPEFKRSTNHKIHPLNYNKYFNSQIPSIQNNERRSLALRLSMIHTMILPAINNLVIGNKIAKSEEFEGCKTWKQYYPEFNLVQGRGRRMV